MKNLGRLLLIAVFVLPIVVCIMVLRNIWSDDDKDIKKPSNGVSVSISDPVYTSGDEIFSGDGIITNSSGETYQMGSETYTTNIGNPISKLYTDAKISAALANVYLEANENSEIVGKLERPTTVTAQKFPQGWSRVSGTDATGMNVSGWVKTSNVSFPSDSNADLNTTVAGGTGTVIADALNLRINPSMNATVLTTIPGGTVLTIKESSNGWHKVTYNNVTGWVSASYVK
ncbi:MAG: SH3 domain-containing protein [Clostridia bacterium]|nr:SH3 domain-containing protein [Clostridia bacterium]